MKKAETIKRVFHPNKEGVSEWKTREQLKGTPLELGLNGNSRHGKFYNDKNYIWECIKDKKNKVLKLRTRGIDKTKSLLHKSRPIRKDIRYYHLNLNTGCVVCGSKSNLVIDHKNDLYNDPRVLDTKTQLIEDFQCLCNHCNLQKRQICKMTKRDNKRYKATNIPMLKHFSVDFIQGDETFDPNDPNAMKGTFWYDPIVFLKTMETKRQLQINWKQKDNYRVIE